MELTLSSAFSVGGLVGHLAYVLLIISMLMRQMVWLRLFVIASALVGISYAVFWLRDPVSSFWESLLVMVNIIQLAITWRQNSRARFTAEERRFADLCLRGLAPGEQRRVINAGRWSDAAPGETLTTEGTQPEELVFLLDGEAEVRVEGKVLARCGPGSYIGEMSLVGGRPASATVTVSAPSRLWRIRREVLDGFDRTQPTWLAVIEAGISRDMREKIVGLNKARLSEVV